MTVIKVEEVSKRYRLGVIGTGTLSRDLNIWWARLRGKESPYASVEDDNRSSFSKDDFWALNNVNLEIQAGDVVGIIGRNGAGKSTLLKILSRVTKPTKGEIKIQGRIASLLEVGTGFHPELTGRENIFLNGAILGMTKPEIRKKMDEIISFSGIEQYVDTPVKRYSSGMYVRLAFAVAAHLEPEILIMDEVLAVGDSEFQKKCLGKMKEVSGHGRTILFVSHNMQAISNLCEKAIWLDKGIVKAEGDVKSVINQYMSITQNKLWKQKFADVKEAPGNKHIRVLYVEMIPELPDPLAPIDIRTPLTVKFRFYNFSNNIILSTNLLLFTLSGDCIFDIPSSVLRYSKGFIDAECKIPGNFLNDGSYYFSLYFVEDTSRELFFYKECLVFDVADFRENVNWYDKWWGYVRPNFPLTMHPVK